MVAGINLYSVGQFLFHSIALRELGEVYYGDLAAIISIMSIVGILQLAFSLTIVKFVSGHKEQEELRNFSAWINWWSILLGATLGGILLLASPLLSVFLKLHQSASIYLLPLIVVPATLIGSSRAILQGLLRFNHLVLSLMAEIILKITLTFFLVWLGYAVFGAIVAVLVGIVGSYLLTRFFLRDVLIKKRGKRPQIGSLLRFSLPVFVQGAALTSMYSTDILLVKHFFSAQEAGVYASVAALGRIAFFVSTPVASVMFPIVSRRLSETQPYKKVFLSSVVITLVLSFSVVLAFKLFPQIFLAIFSGHVLKESIELLWWFALFAGLLSLASLFAQFYFSVGKTKIAWVFALGAILQVLVIWIAHSSLLEVIKVSIGVTSLLTFFLSIYFPYHDRKKS